MFQLNYALGQVISQMGLARIFTRMRRRNRAWTSDMAASGVKDVQIGHDRNGVDKMTHL